MNGIWLLYLKGKHYREGGETVAVELPPVFFPEDTAQPDNGICLYVASRD